MKLPEELVSECEEYNRISNEISRLTTAKDAICNRIKNILKEKETGEFAMLRKVMDIRKNNAFLLVRLYEMLGIKPE